LAGLALRLCSGWADTPKATAATTNSVTWGSDANTGFGSGNDLDTGDLFLKMLGAVVLIIGMGVGLVYVSRKYLPKIRAAGGKRIQIKETTPLGPRKMLHLVEVGGRELLIGSTAERITMLADLSGTLLEGDEAAADSGRDIV